MSEIDKDFRTIINEYLAAKELSQNQAAKLCGMPRQNWHSIMSGKNQPNSKTINKIANALKIDLKLVQV